MPRPKPAPGAPFSPTANDQAWKPAQVQHATIEADWHGNLRKLLGERLTDRFSGQTGAKAIQNFAAQIDAVRASRT